LCSLVCSVCGCETPPTSRKLEVQGFPVLGAAMPYGAPSHPNVFESPYSAEGFRLVVAGEEREFAQRLEAHYEWRYPDYGFKAHIMKYRDHISVLWVGGEDPRHPRWKPKIRVKSIIFCDWEARQLEALEQAVKRAGIIRKAQTDRGTIEQSMTAASVTLSRLKLKLPGLSWVLVRVGEDESEDVAELVIYPAGRISVMTGADSGN